MCIRDSLYITEVLDAGHSCPHQSSHGVSSFPGVSRPLEGEGTGLRQLHSRQLRKGPWAGLDTISKKCVKLQCPQPSKSCSRLHGSIVFTIGTGTQKGEELTTFREGFWSAVHWAILEVRMVSPRLRLGRLECSLDLFCFCLLYTSPSPRDRQKSRMPSSA